MKWSTGIPGNSTKPGDKKEIPYNNFSLKNGSF